MSFWSFVKDVVVASADSALSSVGAGNVIKDSAYSNQNFADASQKFQTVTNKVGTAVVTYFAPPVGAGVALLQRNNLKPDTSTDEDPIELSPGNTGYNTLTGYSSIKQSTNNVPIEASEDFTDYYIVGGIMLVLLVLIIIFLLKK